MDRDCYQIEVLYYLNPHLIWVEVIERSQQDFVFEQIGVYGIIPFETMINSDGGLESQKCDEWAKATAVIMKQAFLDAKEVWFQPIHINRRTSIFDDNIHKYGEILLKTYDGNTLELSKCLTDSGFALLDVCLFHQKLNLGQLKTKLDYIQTQDIIKNLEKNNKTTSKLSKKQREASVKKQTVVFQAAQSLESSLTQKNLRRHDIITGKNEKMLEKKLKDFELCKDVDDESVGRAIRMRRVKSDNSSVNEAGNTSEDSKGSLMLKKKQELLKSQKMKGSDTFHMLMATKKYLEQNALVKNCTTTSESSNNNIEHDTSRTLEKKGLTDNVNCSLDNEISVNMRSVRNGPKKKAKVPEYDLKTEKRIAFGPPGINVMYLPTKIVPKETVEKYIHAVSKGPEDHEEPYKSLEMYADVDSDVDLSNDIGGSHNLCTSNEKESIKDSIEAEKQSKECMPVKKSSNDLNYVSNNNLNYTKPVEKDNTASNAIEESLTESPPSKTFSAMQKKLRILKSIKANKADSIVTSISDISTKDSSISGSNNKSYLDSDYDASDLNEKINLNYPSKTVQSDKRKKAKLKVDVKNNVNPFKNVDPSISVFVDKLVSPILMVHNKMDYPIEPTSNIRDVNFNTNIHVVLKNLSVETPMMLQMISWPVVLRGYSLFMVGPLRSGKTFGYLPAVCRLIADDCKSGFVDSVGPLCIIVCATAQSVEEVEHYARMFLGVHEKVVSCFPGVDEMDITTSLLNGCDLFICTPTVLVRLLRMTDFGVDLRRLSTFVLEDCERLAEVYAAELKYFLIKIREMLKNRANKELKVQFVVASRVWCDFMEVLAKKCPNSVVCIGAFQECVLYSKANTSIDFLKSENKVAKVLEFLEEGDSLKKTVVVCRSSDEVDEVSKVLTETKYAVFSCNDNMTVEDLYNLSKAWQDYEEPLLRPILVCCDGNLTHLNVTDAHYLVHYSLPHLFSMFCKRFAVLNNNYSSIFKEEKTNVKIKIFLEESNAEQLPKIFHFIKRCTDKVPEFIDKLCDRIVQEKDLNRARRLVPLCDNILSFGECPDLWNCQERHAIFKEFDEPKEWVPRNGVITFKILHYHSPAQYSVRLLSNTRNGDTKKYPQTYSSLTLKMAMYFSKTSNQKLHGTPNVGDICAVSVRQNFFVRCQVIKILTWNKGVPNCVLIKLIDEEKLERARDIYLFHLPDELKKIETHVVQVRLANVCPKDNDVTFSKLATNDIKKHTADDDFYMRAKVVMSVGTCILVDTLEACQQLTSLKENVVMHNLKEELLKTHAIANPEHISKMEKLCDFISIDDKDTVHTPAPIIHLKDKVTPQWAELEDEMSGIYFVSAQNPGTFFIRLAKFDNSLDLLLEDIASYVEGDLTPLEHVAIGDLVLAKFPDYGSVERARVDYIVNENVVKCFFVDHGGRRDVQIKDLIQLPDKFITQTPFQAIECRLIGVKPVGEDWTEFSNNWFCDACSDTDGEPKYLYARHFTKETPERTEGQKYGVAIIDTCGDEDVVINQLIVDLNLAQEIDDEIGYLQELPLKDSAKDSEEKASKVISDGELNDSSDISGSETTKALVPINVTNTEQPPLNNIFLKEPIRSVPLVDSDNESAESFDLVNHEDFAAGLKGFNLLNQNQTDPNDGNVKNQPFSNESHNFEFIKAKNDAKSANRMIEFNKNFERGNVSQNAIANLSIKRNSISISKPKRLEDVSLDSDDLSSAEGSNLSGKSTEKFNKEPIKFTDEKNIYLNKIDESRKPKLLWRQNKNLVSIKIQLIGVQKYDVSLENRSLIFNAVCNDVKYGFEFELYGVVDDMIHSDKGQYVFVKFSKVMKKNWLTLTKDGAMRKWIVYDVDSIDSSSDEEETVRNTLADIVKPRDEDKESDSDDDLLDDANFDYL